MWDDVVAQLSTSGDCIALDVPGCGRKRERDTSAIEFDDIVAELISDIEAVGMREVVLVGHSQTGHQVMNTQPQALAAALIAKTQT